MGSARCSSRGSPPPRTARFWSSAGTSLSDDDLAPARASGALLQEVIPEVVERGEISMVYSGRRVQPRRGEAREATAIFACSRISAAASSVTIAVSCTAVVRRRVMTRVPATCLYARVDVVESSRGPLLMELELIEPELYFLMRPGGREPLGAVDRRPARRSMRGCGSPPCCLPSPLPPPARAMTARCGCWTAGSHAVDQHARRRIR